MAWYRSGSVAVTNGSKNVIGTSTAWVNNVQPGDAFIGPDGAYNEVDVVGGNGSLTLVENYAGTTASGGAYKIIPTQGRVRDLAAQVAQLIVDYGAVESALTVDSGRLGLGKTPNASARLDVAGQVWVDAPSGDATLRLLTSGTEKGKLAVTSAGRAYIESNGAAVMHWLNGNVGIGTDTPSAKLTVAGGALLSLRDSANGLLFPDFRIYNTATGNAFAIDNYSSTWLYINSVGNVGIGTVSPSVKLDVVGTIKARDGAATLDMGTVSGGGYIQAYGAAAEAVPLSLYSGVAIGFQLKANGQVRLMPLSSDPAGGQGGDLYFNSTTSKFRGHTGSAWVDLH